MEGEAQVTGLSTVASCLAPGACARDGGQGALRIRKQCGALMRGQADGSSSPPAMRGLTLFLIVEGVEGAAPISSGIWWGSGTCVALGAESRPFSLSGVVSVWVPGGASL